MPKVSKATLETIKTVVIATLITGVVAFVAGMHYQGQLQADKAEAVNTAIKSASSLKK